MMELTVSALCNCIHEIGHLEIDSLGAVKEEERLFCERGMEYAKEQVVLVLEKSVEKLLDGMSTGLACMLLTDQLNTFKGMLLLGQEIGSEELLSGAGISYLYGFMRTMNTVLDMVIPLVD